MNQEKLAAHAVACYDHIVGDPQAFRDLHEAVQHLRSIKTRVELRTYIVKNELFFQWAREAIRSAKEIFTPAEIRANKLPAWCFVNENELALELVLVAHMLIDDDLKALDTQLELVPQQDDLEAKV